MCKGLLLFLLLIAVSANAQQDTLVVTTSSIETKSVSDSVKVEPIYKLKPAVDLPILGIGSAWSLYAFTKIYDKDSSSPAKILSLDKNDIPGFDRWATKYYIHEGWHSGDPLFYGSMPLPVLVILVDGKLRKDFFKLTFLYLETMSITGLLYTGSVYHTNRYRPYAYNPDVEMKTRTRGGAKNSFYAGHVALVASSTFFTAQVLSDYHPASKIKWLYYTIAGAATGTAAYLRLKGGQHFPSDILLGITQGTLTGIFVPRLHKNKALKERLSIVPLMGDNKGVLVVYNF